MEEEPPSKKPKSTNNVMDLQTSITNNRDSWFDNRIHVLESKIDKIMDYITEQSTKSEQTPKVSTTPTNENIELKNINKWNLSLR